MIRLIKNRYNSDLKDLIALFENYTPTYTKTEANFFTIGGRGFYENPFTEVLAYILSSETAFSYRADFIRNLLQGITIADSTIESLIQFAEVSTQFSTDKGKKIDLILYNSECVIVFENKIFHDAVNPFEDYESYTKQKFPNHTQHFILFSYKKQNSCPENWIYLNISDNFKKQQKNITFEIKNKWDYFVLDFLDHFTIKTITMNQNETEFLTKNFHKIIAASNNLNRYIAEIAEDFKNENEINGFQIVNWNYETKAVRFFPIAKNESNVVLIFDIKGDFSVAVYYYSDYKKYNDAIREIVGIDYECWSEGKKNPMCCFALKDKPFSELKAVLEEIKNQIERMKQYYANSISIQ